MAKKQAPKRTAPAPKAGPASLGPAVEALTQATQSLSATAAQMMEILKQIATSPKVTAAAAPVVASAAPAQINIWEDDPFSEQVPSINPKVGTPIAVDVPANANPLLQTQIVDPAPPPAAYAPGTTNFLYWAAAEAIARGINFWAPLLPDQTRWTTSTSPMPVTLVAGQDLNANYTRIFGLRFFQRTVHNLQIFSGESPDIVCHELGHAILDALKPQLFNAASMEVSAFHESFGDMSAILVGLQLPTARDRVIQETQGHLNVNSRLSRVAEQVGWGIRQLSPTAVDADCLRNAANRFFYKPPAELPPVAPATQLASEVHSFSRVFTGAFLDALNRMLVVSGAATSENLLAVSRAMGQLLIDAVHLAPITSAYYSQVAATMIQVDQTRSGGQNREALSSAFIEHGILSPSSSALLETAATPAAPMAAAALAGSAAGPLSFGGAVDDGYLRTAQDAPDLPAQTITTTFGLTLQVHLPSEPERFTVASASLTGGGAVASSAEQDAHSFLEDLVQLGRIDVRPAGDAVPVSLAPAVGKPRDRKSHILERNEAGELRLKRLHFQCDFPHAWRGDGGSVGPGTRDE